MPALVESMFYAGREVPWHGLGKQVEHAPSSSEAIIYAGLDWDVIQEPVFLLGGKKIEGAYANLRSTDRQVLGVVGNKYKIVQNREAFSFTDALLGEGVKYETAGSLRDGKTVWLLAKLPDTYEILGDKVDPYVCFTNTHDGTGSVKVVCTNVRVVCNNTLSLALRTAQRSWSTRHTGNVNMKLEEARETLDLADKYMKATQQAFEELHQIKFNDATLFKTLDIIVPFDDEMPERQKNNAKTVRDDIITRYRTAPDLVNLDHTAARFIQAVADTSDHMDPLRKTKNFDENRFRHVLDGNTLVNKAYKVLVA